MNSSRTALKKKKIKKKTYVHYLQNHVGDLMMINSILYNWGYGVFCCHACDHLNKLTKTSKITDTNLDKIRFIKVTQVMRVKQPIFTDLSMKKQCTEIIDTNLVKSGF